MMILVIGGTGTTGTEVIKELSRLGATTRALVRKRSTTIDLPGIQQVLGDLERAETLSPALEGVTSALLLSSPSPDAARLQGNFIEAARRAKLPHLVRHSAFGTAAGSRARLFRQHAEVEKHVQDAGVPYTFLRPAQFMQNFLTMKDSIVGRGEFYAPQGKGRVNLVDVRDVAAVTARVLTEGGHEAKTYEITGPEAISYDRVAEAFSQALRRPVRYVDVPPETFRQNLVQFGIPDWMADGLIELYDIWRNNGATQVTDVVEKVGKKKPNSIDTFARDYAASFLGQSAAGG
jgi:uncharacterized protein YbjT (DUF2867 family)